MLSIFEEQNSDEFWLFGWNMQEMDKFLENRNFSISLSRILIHYNRSSELTIN